MTPTSSLCATGLASPEPRLLGGRGPAAAASHLRHRGHGKSAGARQALPAAPGLGSRLRTAGVVLSPSPVSSCPASLLPAGRRPHWPLSPSFPQGCVCGAGRAPRRGCPCPPFLCFLPCCGARLNLWFPSSSTACGGEILDGRDLVCF